MRQLRSDAFRATAERIARERDEQRGAPGVAPGASSQSSGAAAFRAVHRSAAGPEHDAAAPGSAFARSSSASHADGARGVSAFHRAGGTR